jgi:hypothetical protein
MKVTIPPADFDPHTASDSELHRYGFPPRPASPSARHRWDLMYPKKNIHYIVPAMCQARSPLTHQPHRTGGISAASPLVGLPPADTWSGGIAQQAAGKPGYTFSDVRWTEPSFSASCPERSAYSIWSGLGGNNTDTRSTWGLLQAGVSNQGGIGPNDDYGWWEVLNQNPAKSLGEQIITTFHVSAGDQVQAVTYYNRPDRSVSFQLYNLTTNQLVTLGPWRTIEDQNGTIAGSADEYYDGTSGEMIVERPLHSGSPVDLRKPSAGYSKFLDSALGNDDNGDPYPGYQFPNWRRLDMQAKKTNDLLTSVSGFPTKAGDQGWTNTWYSCS